MNENMKLAKRKIFITSLNTLMAGDIIELREYKEIEQRISNKYPYKSE